MDNQKVKNILKKIGKIILIIIIIVTIGLTNGKYRSRLWIENFVGIFTTLPQRLITYLRYVTSDDANESYETDILRKENEDLKAKIKDMKDKVIDYDLVLQENDSYKELDKTKDAYKEYEVVLADIIFKTQNNWDDIYIINKGSKHSIKPNMTVITTEGLVGFVLEVGDDTSKVVSILDASSSFSAVASNTREQVIAKGDLNLKTENKLKIVDIPLHVSYKSGDEFETSGIGGKYQKGISIGKVSSFVNKNNPLENEAIIHASVDFDRLERVAVIIEENSI